MEAGGAARTLRFERPKDAPRSAPLGSQALAFDLFDRWAQHPGHGLTPRRVVAIYRAAEEGWPQQQCDLFDDVIESDGHLRAQLDSRLESVAGKGWVVQAGGESSTDLDAAAMLENALRDVPNFDEMIAHLLQCNWYGYSLSEIVWDYRGGRIVPVWFANVPHRRFVFPNGEPRLVTEKQATDGEALDPGRWIYMRRQHRLATMSGLMRTATWWALFKRIAVRDWVVFAEKFGLPYVTGSYDDAMPENEREALKDAVASIGTDGHAVFSDAGNIQIHETRRGGADDSIHAALTGLCNSEISKLISGATLTSGEGTSTGSYALARVHQERAFDLIVGDAEKVEDVFTVQLAVPFLAFNGITARPPRLKIHVVRATEPETRMKLISAVVNELGIPVDETQVRSEFQIKAPVGAPVTGVRGANGSA